MSWHQPSFVHVPTRPLRSTFISGSGSASTTITPCRPCSNVTMKSKSGPKSKGFGIPPPPSSPNTPSESTNRREKASQKYDEMVASGMPEYSVWFGLKEGGVAEDTSDEEMPWLPVGAISVPRSSQVVDALFERKTMEDLMQGAMRLYPKLRNEDKENIQFGYQLKEFDDEPIRVAERTPQTGFQATLTKIFRRLQNPLSQ